MQSLGFSNVIISNSVFNKDVISYEMQLMQEYGFRRMIFALNHDVTSDTVSQYIEKRNEISKLINSSAPRGALAMLTPNLLMTKDSVYEKQISRLAIRKTQYVFVEFPAFDGKEWIDSTLNYLLYKQKKKPVFMSFEKNIATYDEEFILHLITTRLSAFMIDLNSFANPKAIPYIKRLIDANAVIIPGISGVIEDYANLYGKLNYFRSIVGQPLYSKMIINSSKSTQIVFGL